MTLNLPILYEDEAIVAVDKPAGLLSVPGRGADKFDSVETRAQAYIAGARAIHRLDMATSGIMLIAKHKAAERYYKQQFEQRLVDKTYHAITHGIINPPTGTMDWPLIADWPNRPRQKVCYEHGKAALTHYRLLATDISSKRSMVELLPITGRSHQLRVHLATLGHPIVGDELYAHEQRLAPRLLLHASDLSCQMLNQQVLHLHSPLPFALKL